MMYFLAIFSVILCFLNAFLPIIAKLIVRLYWQYNPSSSLLNEIEAIRIQMNSISMKEEFAKYTKLQRVLNKKLEEHKTEVRANKSSQLKFKLIIQYLSQGILTVTCLILFWTQRSTPVVILNEDWLHPFGSILSWPTHIPGALSFPIWFLVSSSVAKLAAKQFA